jgi:hypothetical protein
MPTTVIPLDDLPKKTTGSTTEKPKFKSSTATTATMKGGSKAKNTPKPVHESEIDMENLPVIQGSFEITKTDADIAQKRSSAAAKPATTSNTLKPFHISPASSIKVKTSGQQQQQQQPSSTSTPTASTAVKTDKIVEMFLQHQKNLQQKAAVKDSPVTAKIEKTNKSGETTTKATTAKSGSSGGNLTSTPLSSTIAIKQTSSTTAAPQVTGGSQINKDLPKLDASLFTSAPVLDNEPWRPINPSPEQMKTNLAAASSTTEISSAATSIATEMPAYRSPFNPPPSNENVIYRNKFVDPDTAYPVNDSSDESVFYQSFYNPDFSAGSLEVEKLGTVDVRPYPLPVNKIDVSEESTASGPKIVGSDNKKLLVIDATNYDENKFEHLGGGVIAKKHDASGSDNNSTAISDNYQSENTTVATATMKINVNDTGVKDDSDSATSLDDIFQELLDSNDMYNSTDVLESRIAPDDNEGDADEEEQEDGGEGGEGDAGEEILTTTQKLNFMNMKNFIMQMQHNKSDSSAESTDVTTLLSSTDAPTTSTSSSSSSSAALDIVSTVAATTLKPTTTFVEVDTVKYTPSPSAASTLSEPQLFPSISKWEFVNGTRANISELSVTKKVFNETLQAVIVENVQERQAPAHNATQRLDDLRGNQTLDKGNLQQLSSIFDTLAAKLGIRTDVSSKVPPFAPNIQNKLKQSAGNQNRSSTRKNTSTTVPIKQHVTTAKTTKKSATPLGSLVKTTRVTTTTSSTTTASPPTTDRSDPTRGYELSSESFMGQAEVEPVDPTQYEEILSKASSPITRITSTTPSLVTLLPVKSNSGIRNFNPRLRLASSNQQATSSETRNMETVVKASMSFDA